MKSFHEEIIEEGIIKPQIRKQVGWIDEVRPQSAWNKLLAWVNCSFDCNEEGHESEDLDKLSHLLKRKVTSF